MGSGPFLEGGRQKPAAEDAKAVTPFAITCLTNVFGVAMTFLTAL